MSTETDTAHIDTVYGIEALARRIACYQDGGGEGPVYNGTNVCAAQWEIARAEGIDWWELTAAVKRARVQL